jgi:hypothetical protein
VEIASKPLGDQGVERSLVQILVVVAITQMRILRAEVGKGSVLTVVGYGLVDPEIQVNSAETAAVPLKASPRSKGNQDKSPEPMMGLIKW